MKIIQSIAIIMSASIITLSFQSCKKGKKTTNISAHNKSESHNMGKNCMSCHKQSGEGAEGGWFKVAGTVFDNTAKVNPNTTVYLYSGPDATGTLKYTIQVDALGNFYTTEAIDFGSGLYPSVQGSTITNHMSSAITSGECNSCHGVSTGKIWTE